MSTPKPAAARQAPLWGQETSGTALRFLERQTVPTPSLRAERRAAPKPARIPVVYKVDRFVAHGDRPMYSSDEGLS